MTKILSLGFMILSINTLVMSVDAQTTSPQSSKRLYAVQYGGTLDVELLEQTMSTHYKDRPPVVVTDIQYDSANTTIAIVIQTVFNNDIYWIYNVRANVGNVRGAPFKMYVFKDSEFVRLTTVGVKQGEGNHIFDVSYTTLGLTGRPPFGTPARR